MDIMEKGNVERLERRIAQLSATLIFLSALSDDKNLHRAIGIVDGIIELQSVNFNTVHLCHSVVKQIPFSVPDYPEYELQQQALTLLDDILADMPIPYVLPNNKAVC
jgi:hypothetical protein